MRFILALILTALAGPALAHIGHLGEVAGHGHWIALGGIAIAGAIALLGGRKKSGETDVEADADETDDAETEGSPA